jgi:rifampicin phosphotransferase
MTESKEHEGPDWIRRASPSEGAPFVLPLQGITEKQRRLVGGKAAGLSRLMRERFPVPPGLCVTTAAFDAFLAACPNRDQLSGMLARLSPQRARQEAMADLASISQEVSECLGQTKLPPAVEEALLEAWRKSGEARSYAVRSSATVEDGGDHSFAGQFDSVLSVRGQEALLAAVKRCWLSLFSVRALAYQRKQGLSPGQIAMAVVVQEMVPATAAGVLFTVDPLTGSSSRTTIEATPGLGDKLVAGQVKPERLVLEKKTLRVLEHQAPDGPCHLNEPVARRLGELARQAESLQGGPLDIEWALSGEAIWLLQARPVTGQAAARAREDRQVWTNLNTGEVFPDVVTPVTWSMIQRFIIPLFRSIFRMIGADVTKASPAGLVAGRLYFNVNMGLAALRPFPYGSERLSNVAMALGGGQTGQYQRMDLEILPEDLPDLGFSWPKYILSWPRIVLDLIAHSPRRAEAFKARVRARTAQLVRQDFARLNTAELARAIPQMVEEHLGRWDLLYLFSRAGALLLFERACRQWLGDKDCSIRNRLFAGLGGLPDTEAGLALWRLAKLAHGPRSGKSEVRNPKSEGKSEIRNQKSETAGLQATSKGDDWSLETVLLATDRWEEVRRQLVQSEPGREFLAAWDAFMAEHGHHCQGELELFNARWAEKPDYIFRLVRAYLSSIEQFNPVENQRRLAAEREQLTKQCRRQLRNPIKRRLFGWAARGAQQLAVDRETWKNEVVRQLTVLRRALLRLGERLHQDGALARSDDVFFLEIDEIESVGTGRAPFDAKERVAARRAEYEKNLGLKPPAVVQGRYDQAMQATPAPDANTTVLSGIPIFPGRVTARARVMPHADEHAQVQAGEILVAPFTDPAWTPYFIPAVGVVIEQGGVLSHGSIIAREYGLPAVTNVASATRVIRTGDMIEVDGNRGQVRIVKRE